MKNWWERRKERWKDVPPHDRLNTFFTFVIAAATVVYVIVASKTLTEIRNSKADTNRIIIASETQASAAQNIAAASDRNADAAEKNAGAAASFAVSARGINQHTDQAVSKLKLQADETRVANEQAKKAMNVQSRPWIGISNVALEGDGDRAKLNISNVHMAVRNYGSSPAIRLIHKFFYLSDNGEWSSLQNICAQLNDREQRISAPGSTGTVPTGDIVFPGDGIEKSFRDTPTRVNLVTSDVFLIVCLSYQTTFDQDWHHTRGLYVGRSPTFVGRGNPPDPYGKATKVNIEMKPQNVQAD